MTRYSILLVMIPILLFFCSQPGKLIYRTDVSDSLYDSSLTVLYLPADTLFSEYVDNAKWKSKREFSDSFYIEVLNNIVPFALSQSYNTKVLPDDSTIISTMKEIRLLYQNKDSSAVNSISELIKSIGTRYDTDLVALCNNCQVKFSAIRQKGWRGGRSGTPYQRPVEYIATASISLQIWDKNGKLLFEKVGFGHAEQPFLYAKLKVKDIDEDLVEYSKKLYAAPIARAINEAGKSAAKID